MLNKIYIEINCILKLTLTDDKFISYKILTNKLTNITHTCFKK